jgi:hypothetical protein
MLGIFAANVIVTAVLFLLWWIAERKVKKGEYSRLRPGQD